MTDTATAEKPSEAPLQVVLKQSEGFAPRTRKSTSDALTALKPSLDAVKTNSPKVFTVVMGVTPAKAASLVSLLNERYDNKWTFGGRSTDNGTAIVQARYSASPELARPVRKTGPRKSKDTNKKGAK